jgi:SAM-dependent methyltransferase
VLPPDLAAFTFSLDRAGTDDAIAARTALALPSGRVVVAGAQRRGLLTTLAGRGLDVVAFDPVRGVLPAARAAAERAGVADRLTLFAADPRDFDVPGGCDAALLPSSVWRLLTHADGRTSSLACFRRALRPGGALLVDCDVLPGDAPDSPAPLRDGPGHQRWTWARAGFPGTVRITCDAPGVAPISIDLHDLSPAATADAVRAAGFSVATIETVESATNAADRRDLTPESRRAWIVARKPA